MWGNLEYRILFWEMQASLVVEGILQDEFVEKDGEKISCKTCQLDTPSGDTIKAFIVGRIGHGRNIPALISLVSINTDSKQGEIHFILAKVVNNGANPYFRLYIGPPKELSPGPSRDLVMNGHVVRVGFVGQR